MPPLFKTRASVTFILVTLFIDYLGLGLAYPVIPRLVQSFLGEEIAAAAVVYAGLLSIYAVAQFFCAPVIGALSDRYGRRPVILAALFGLLVDYVVLTVAPNVWWLVAGRVVAGVFGATYTTANAYVADVTPPEKRAGTFGLVGVAVGLGFIAGPVAGGLLGAVDLRLPFMAAAAITGLNLIFGLLVMPESLAPEHRRPLRLGVMNPIGAVRQITRFGVVARLLPAFLVAQLVQQGVQAVWVPYATYRFGWGAVEIGFSFAALALFVLVTQGAVVRPVVSRFGEARAMVFSLLATVVGLVALGLATAGAAAYVGIALYSVGLGVLSPAVRSLMSRTVPRDEQGLLMGAIGSLITPTAIIAPPIANGIFALAIRPDVPVVVPGAPFFVAGILALVALALAPRRVQEETMRSRAA